LSDHAGDRSIRVLPKLVLGGLGHSVRWSVTTGFYYRPDSKIGAPARAPGNASGSELQLGASIYYAHQDKRFAIGPEMTFGTVLTGSTPFTREFSSLELLLGLHHNIKSQVMLGVAGGIGLLRAPGTPDFRLLLRLAYAPQAKKKAASSPDRDRDGIPDGEDACPDVPGMRSADPARNGCPPPPRDRDNDGIPDAEDRCPDQQPGDFPDTERRGCPEDDIDHDGVPNAKDLCPMVPAGPHPDSRRPGCPATDMDGDTFYDDIDECPNQAAGLTPDPMRIGCPLPDRDKDSVPDGVDACIDRPGAPDVDPKKNGCPGLVRIERGLIVILSPVFFATNKDVILPRSFPVLQAVVNAINAQPLIKRVSIEGHTDNRGTPGHNRDLSERRAKSVMRWLVTHGVAAKRVESHGYGMDRPIATNKTAIGRAQNRRVEFHITDPLPPPPGTP
jgi:OOP family OmpA-OmpF porin